MSQYQFYDKSKIDSLLGYKIDNTKTITSKTRKQIYDMVSNPETGQGAIGFVIGSLASTDIVPEEGSSANYYFEVHKWNNTNPLQGRIIAKRVVGTGIYSSQTSDNGSTWTSWVKIDSTDKVLMNTSALTNQTRAGLYQLLPANAFNTKVFPSIKFTAAESPVGEAQTSFCCMVNRVSSNYGQIIASHNGLQNIYMCSFNNSTTASAWVKLATATDLNNKVTLVPPTITGMTRVNLSKNYNSGFFESVQWASASEAPNGASTGTTFSVWMIKHSSSWANIFAVQQNQNKVYMCYVQNQTTATAWSLVASDATQSFRVEYEDGTRENINFMVR